MLVPMPIRHAPGWLGEFKSFVVRGNVVNLAIGIVVGAAFASIVNHLIKDVVTPVLGLLIVGIDFTNLFVTIKGPYEATLDAAQEAGMVTSNAGLFLNACISFLITSFAVFWVVTMIARFASRPESIPVKLTGTETALLEIRDLLARDRS